MRVETGVIVLFLSLLREGSSVYDTPQRIESEGYIAETHHVTTPDGYILEMHRIPFKRNETSGQADRPVVFCLHGLMGISSQFIALGREYGIPYNLADAGYDVWLGNARGNRNSRRHVTLNPDDRATRVQFFDFTWHEIGSIDVPTMIDYILEHTGRPQLHYIGHSQGGTSFLVLSTTRPEYMDKIASAHLLAGVGYKNYFPHFFLRNLAMFTNPIWGLAERLGTVEVVPPNPLLPLSASNKTDELWENCFGDINLRELCVLTGVRDLMQSTYNTSTSEVTPDFGGASLKQVAHYGQNIQNRVFRRWDYGTVQRNIEMYGTPEPPIYNLSLITVNVTMHYTLSDDLLDPRDVYAMAEDMPNTVYRRIARDTFSHVDFIAANDVKELVTDYIVDAIAYVHSRDDEIEPNPIDPSPTDSSSTIYLSIVIKMYLIIYSFYCIIKY